MVTSADQELLNGNTVNVVFYGGAVKGGNGQVSQLDPGFSVVQWGSGYRLLALNFRPEQPSPQQWLRGVATATPPLQLPSRSPRSSTEICQLTFAFSLSLAHNHNRERDGRLSVDARIADA